MATASKAFPNRSWVVLHVEATAGTPNVANNQTPITYSVWVYGTKAGGYYYNWPNAGNRLEFWIDNTRIKFTEHLLFDFRTGVTVQNKFTGTTNVTHNSDGTKSITVKAKYVDSTAHPSLKDNECSVGMTLSTIPRATEIVSFSNFNTTSTSISVNLSRKSTAFTHDVSLKIGSTTCASWNGVAAFNGAGTFALSTTQRNNLLNALTSSQASATATLTVVTKSGSTTVGTKTATATYTASPTTITSFSAFNSGSSSLSVTLSRKNSLMTQVATLKIGSTTIGSWTANFDGASTLALSATHKNNLLNALPTSTSATATLSVVTTTPKGKALTAQTKTATYTIASGIVPTITSPTLTITNPTGAISGKTRNYAIQNVSTLKVAFTRTAPQGTTIKSTVVTIGSQTSSSNPASIISTASGSLDIKITVTDNRNRVTTSTALGSVSVIAYSALSAVLSSFERIIGPTDLQDRLEAKLKLTVSPITSGGVTTNAFNVKIQSVPAAGGSTTTAINQTYDPGTASATTYTYNPSTTYEEMSVYNLTFIIQDDFSTVTIKNVLPTASYPLVIGEHGIGVGKIPEANRALDIAGRAYIDDFPIHKKITDLIYFPASSSWYRVLEVPSRSFYLELILYRTYNSPSPEIHRLGIGATYNGGGITKIDSHGNKVFTNARLLYDTNASRCYVDLKYNNPSYGNNARLFYDYYSISKEVSTSYLILPSAANAVAESTTGYTVFSQVAL